MVLPEVQLYPFTTVQARTVSILAYILSISQHSYDGWAWPSSVQACLQNCCKCPKWLQTVQNDCIISKLIANWPKRLQNFQNDCKISKMIATCPKWLQNVQNDCIVQDISLTIYQKQKYKIEWMAIQWQRITSFLIIL